MNRIVEELKKVKVFFVATSESGWPCVRPFSSVTEFEGQVYICTGKHKDVYEQINGFPHIAVSGVYDDGKSWIRMAAKCIEDDRIEAQQAMLDDPTGPSMLYKAGDGDFVVFRLEIEYAIKESFDKERENLVGE